MNVTKNNEEGEGENGTVVIRKDKTELPKKYKVLLHNDDYTTMEFVVIVLQKIFHKSFAQAQEIMLNIHNKSQLAALFLSCGNAVAAPSNIFLRM